MSAIGIFDSGVGGITVLRALRSAFPNETFIYLGDTARLPYGSKSPQTIRRYLTQNVAFLLSFPIKAIVVACNSASTVVEGDFWRDIPLYDVIRPGALAAVSATKNRHVGILGTRATVTSGAYVHAIHALDPDITCFQQACPLLVPLVEEGWQSHPVSREILMEYLAEPLASGADTLILGCTHYPVLKSVIREIVGPKVRLIDSADVLVDRIGMHLRDGHIQPDRGDGSITVWTTDSGAHFHQIGQSIMGDIPLDTWQLADIR
ncbi:MAG: glutamate racemase [Acidobacteria bacterium]|nr:glutamate racemase [Acidobacteriota bacterium]